MMSHFLKILLNTIYANYCAITMIILDVESLVMKKMFLIVSCMLLVNIVFAQNDTATINDINRFQKELIDEYKNETTSPLSKKAKKEFKGIHFFPVDMQYVVTAKFVRTANEKIFAMPTSGNVTKQYVKFGEATFTESLQLQRRREIWRWPCLPKSSI